MRLNNLILIMISMSFSCASGVENLKSKTLMVTEKTAVATINPPAAPTIPYENFIEPILKIDKKYARSQKKHEVTKQKGHYVYEMISMPTFPFFCLPGNQKPEFKYTPVYSNDCKGIFYYKDESSIEHIQLAYLNYIQWGGSKYPPIVKTYTLYNMRRDVVQGWVEENRPITVSLVWNKNEGQYKVVQIK
jgi:hypothetical protein